MLTFYYATDTCALASHIALKDAGADYRLKRIDFAAAQQRSPDYLALNPKGRVPALVTPAGILTETPAILAYIAQSWPQAGLAPTDPFRFAKVQEFNSYLCSTLHVAHAHRMRGTRWADDPAAIEAMKRKVPQSVSACYDYVETQIAGPWVMGADYTIADAYLFTVAQWLEGDGVDPARYPKVIDHRTRMAARPNVKAAIEEEFATQA
ncbi:MAG: glutathione S-transferase family protein [Proteobacteria bacterium]|nr:glutathione S-transferase family protein [Pseudomonadota bacterium]